MQPPKSLAKTFFPHFRRFFGFLTEFFEVFPDDFEPPTFPINFWSILFWKFCEKAQKPQRKVRLNAVNWPTIKKTQKRAEKSKTQPLNRSDSAIHLCVGKEFFFILLLCVRCALLVLCLGHKHIVQDSWLFCCVPKRFNEWRRIRRTKRKKIRKTSARLNSRRRICAWNWFAVVSCTWIDCTFLRLLLLLLSFFNFVYRLLFHNSISLKENVFGIPKFTYFCIPKRKRIFEKYKKKSGKN